MKLLLAILMAFSLSATVTPIDGNKVKFIVTDPDGAPIGDAQAVAIWKIAGGERTYKSCKTDNEGTCEVYGVPNQNDVIVSAEKDGYFKRDGLINVNGETPAKLVLKPSR